MRNYPSRMILSMYSLIRTHWIAFFVSKIFYRSCLDAWRSAIGYLNLTARWYLSLMASKRIDAFFIGIDLPHSALKFYLFPIRNPTKHKSLSLSWASRKMETPSYRAIQVKKIEEVKISTTANRAITRRSKSKALANLSPTLTNKGRMEKSRVKAMRSSRNWNRRNSRDRRKSRKTMNLTSCIIRNKISDDCSPISQYSATSLPSALAVLPPSALKLIRASGLRLWTGRLQVQDWSCWGDWDLVFALRWYRSFRENCCEKGRSEVACRDRRAPSPAGCSCYRRSRVPGQGRWAFGRVSWWFDWLWAAPRPIFLLPRRRRCGIFWVACPSYRGSWTCWLSGCSCEIEPAGREGT